MTNLPNPALTSLPAAGWTPPIPRAAAAGAGLTGADVVRILRQRTFLILGLWLFFVAATIGVTAAVQVYFPLSSAEALVQVTSLQASNPNDPLNPQLSRQEDIERLLLDQSLLATSPDVIKDTLADPEVRRTGWFADATEKLKRDATKGLDDQLKGAIAVLPIRRSSLLKVVAETKIPADAPILANILVDKYIAAADKLSKSVYQNSETDLNRRRTAEITRRDSKKKAIDDWLTRYPFVASMATGQRTAVDDDVTYYNALKNDFATQALNYKSQWEALQRIGTQAIQPSDEILALVEQDPLIGQYRQQISSYEQNRLGLSQTLGPNHRRVREMDSSIADLKEKLESARNDAQNRYLTQQREQAMRQYSEAQQILVRLEDLYEEAIGRQADQQDKLKDYRQWVLEYDQLQQKVEDLTKSSDQLSAVINRTRTVQIAQVASATIPLKRSRPNWILYVPVGVGFGLLLALGIALLLEYTDTSVRTARDVRRHADMSVLGVIPAAEDDEVDITQIETAALTQPNSVTAEAFRTMRTNLFFAAPAEQQGTLLISSPSPGEGKTTVAINLAAAIAMSGRRVLLVDANFRRPSLRAFFPDAKSDGLTNILIGQARLADLVSTTTLTGLDILSTGPIPPNPAELLSSGYLRDMITEARSRYDQIIFDGPPALLVSDAMVLAGLIDGVIVVCRFGRTSRGALQRAHAQLEAVGARILGAALNAVQTTRGGYFREQYRAFYEYRPEGDLSEPGQLPTPSDTPQKGG